MEERRNDVALRVNRIRQSKERTQQTMEKEDYLLKQIDEFRDKARKLQELLNTKEGEAKALQNLVDERQGQADELEEVINARQTEADEMYGGVNRRMEALITQLQETVDKLTERVETGVRENGDQTAAQIRILTNEMTSRMADFTAENRKDMERMTQLIERQTGAIPAEQVDQLSKMLERQQTGIIAAEQIDQLADLIRQQTGVIPSDQLDRITEVTESVAGKLQDLNEENRSNMAQINATLDRRLGDLNEETQSNVKQMTHAMSSQIGELTEQNETSMTKMTLDMTARMDDLSEQLKTHLTDFTSQTQGDIGQIKEAVNGQMGQTVESLNSQMSGLKEDLSEKIHTEDVKCYRNIKDLFDEQKPLIEQVETGVRNSSKPVKKYLYWLILFAALDLAGIISLILIEAGVL